MHSADPVRRFFAYAGHVAYRPFAVDSSSAERQGLTLWFVILLVVAYVVPGLVGHDPWKQDEAYVFGGVLDMIKDGDWVVVKVGGVPFMEKPPLFHWIAVLSAKVFSPWLPLHDGARLASGMFVATAVAAIAVASHILWGHGTG